jgi:hypothetical protein
MPARGLKAPGRCCEALRIKASPFPSPPVSWLRRSQTTAAHRPGTAPQRSLGARLSSTTTNSAHPRLATSRGCTAHLPATQQRAARARPTERRDREFAHVRDGAASVGGDQLKPGTRSRGPRHRVGPPAPSSGQLRPTKSRTAGAVRRLWTRSTPGTRHPIHAQWAPQEATNVERAQSAVTVRPPRRQCAHARDATALASVRTGG